MKNQKTLGERLKHLRGHYRLSQAAFASRIGASHIAISNIEMGFVELPRQKTLEAIAKEFGTTIDWLLEGKGEMIPGGSFEFEKRAATDGNPWKEEAYTLLKEEKEAWKQKFEQLFDAMIKGGSLGKYKASIIRRAKKDRLMLVRE